MSEQNREEWHNGKRSRISDVDKAHVMALASKQDEEAAAAIRYVANEGLTFGEEGFEATLEEPSEYAPEYYNESIGYAQLDDPTIVSIDGLVERIKDHQQRADKDAEFAGEGYDKLQATKR